MLTESIKPTVPDQPPSTLQNIVEEAERTLKGVNPAPFSYVAFVRVKEKISEFTAQLLSESIKIAKRHRVDIVSTSHVELASQYLVSNTSHKFFKHVGTIGGIILGTGFSNILSMVTVNQFSTTGILISFSLTAIGAFMVAVHIAKE